MDESSLKDAIQRCDLDAVREIRQRCIADGLEKETWTIHSDMALRAMALDISRLPEKDVTDTTAKYLAFAIALAQDELVSRTIPVVFLSDIFDGVSTESAERIFGLVEQHVDVWRTLLGESASCVLRMCNDLGKRLSRSIHTLFTGRILRFLTRYYPLNERSGLNTTFMFNTANVTTFDGPDEAAPSTSTDDQKSEDGEKTEDGEKAEEGEISDTLDSRISVDYALYSRFWQLQKVFSQPNTLQEQLAYRQFKQGVNEILNLFLSYKLDKSRRDEDSKKPNSNAKPTAPVPFEDDDDAEDLYFAKYLTNSKLLPLQLNGARFRRQFIIQCIVVAQYMLTEDAKSKSRWVVSEEQLRWANEMQEKCYKILRNMPIRGQRFANAVKKLQTRERLWSDWKNASCPPYSQQADPGRILGFKRRPRAAAPSDDVLDLGNPKLTQLWNIEPNMLRACSDPKRNFVPKLADFLAEPLDEIDPEQQVEAEYMSVWKPEWQWRASRILSTTASSYCTNNTLGTAESIDEFFELVVGATAGEVEELAEKAKGVVDRYATAKQERKAREAQEVARQKAEAEAAKEQQASGPPAVKDGAKKEVELKTPETIAKKNDGDRAMDATAENGTAAGTPARKRPATSAAKSAEEDGGGTKTKGAASAKPQTSVSGLSAPPPPKMARERDDSHPQATNEILARLAVAFSGQWKQIAAAADMDEQQMNLLLTKPADEALGEVLDFFTTREGQAVRRLSNLFLKAGLIDQATPILKNKPEPSDVVAGPEPPPSAQNSGVRKSAKSEALDNGSHPPSQKKSHRDSSSTAAAAKSTSQSASPTRTATGSSSGDNKDRHHRSGDGGGGSTDRSSSRRDRGADDRRSRDKR